MAKNDPAPIRKLKAYVAKDNHSIGEIFKGLDRETDRAAIVIAGSIVEDALRNVIEAHMRVFKKNQRQMICGVRKARWELFPTKLESLMHLSGLARIQRTS